jgi:hypothetical protein
VPKPAEKIDTDQSRKRVHIALPVRVTYSERGVRAPEMACTYDIHPRGARIAGLRHVQRVGELLTVERGRNKTLCRITWIGDTDSDLRGQCGIECVDDDKPMWESELAETIEAYDPILARRSVPTTRTQKENRRLTPRFLANGKADILRIPSVSCVPATLQDLSERGCLLQTGNALMPGTDLKLVLNITECDVTVKGRVRHGASGLGIGIEFHEIRRGDRPLLNHLLRSLAAAEQTAEPWTVEIVAPSM